MPLMMIERTIKMKLKKLFRALALCTAGVLACAVLTACGDKGDSSSQTSAAVSYTHLTLPTIRLV